MPIFFPRKAPDAGKAAAKAAADVRKVRRVMRLQGTFLKLKSFLSLEQQSSCRNNDSCIYLPRII
jgi:hypothetical protein